jgi:hypothetical protein
VAAPKAAALPLGYTPIIESVIDNPASECSSKSRKQSSNFIDEAIIKKPTPIELELKYIEKTLGSQTRKRHSQCLIFLPHLSNLHQRIQ